MYFVVYCGILHYLIGQMSPAKKVRSVFTTLGAYCVYLTVTTEKGEIF